MNIPKEFLDNQVFAARAGAFNRQLIPALGTPSNGIHNAKEVGTTVHEDGSVDVNLYGPTATEVTAGYPGNMVNLVKGEDGMWTGKIQYEQPGLKQLLFFVDGVRIVNPLAPVAYGWGYPINYIEIPDVDQDYLLIKDVPHGTVSQEYFFSKVTGEWECCYVYTPPKYRDDVTTTYPVLYLQHGGGENETCWTQMGKANFIMDNLLAEGKAVPFIIVMNNDMMQVNTDGHPHEDTPAFVDMLVEDCIPFIEAHYRTAPGKENRAVAGLSMGSLLSGRLIMEHTDKFGSAGLFTGYLNPVIPGRPVAPQPHLKALENVEYFNKEVHPFFGAIGDQEPSVPLYYKEGENAKATGLNYIQKMYPGEHEWRVWRAAFHDYAQMVFQK